MPEPAWALITDANFCPFSSSEIFFAAEVLPSKNASQFVVICAVALPAAAGLLAFAVLPAAGEEAAGDEGGALDGEAVAGEPELQAATVAASARPSAGPAIRRARRWNRMTRLLCLGRVNW
jgi:hypothetical protein